jgi:DNA-binding CsgD family transcriptional regulator
LWQQGWYKRTGKRQRAKIVLMAAEGYDNDEIALRLDTRREIAR